MKEGDEEENEKKKRDEGAFAIEILGASKMGRLRHRPRPP